MSNTTHPGRLPPGQVDPAQLRAQLEAAERPGRPAYLLLAPLTPDSARFAFLGPFEGETVLWQAELVTLRTLHHQALAQHGSAPPLRQLIEIAEVEQDPWPIRIGLALERLDAGSVLKTVIMVRNYKRLRRGGMEYGEVVEIGEGA